MFSSTLRAEVFANSAAICWRSRCQVEPCGASVPSLMRTACAEAAEETRSNASANRFIGSSVGEDVVLVGQQVPGAALREHVGEAVVARLPLVVRAGGRLPPHRPG